ncbi:ABC-type transport system substrate-binding protein [Saccharopolyspora lacisalsi]|uniref:ABC-type transport system substrate-binding protein n=1 Tax=Halosaccharopolyspora lacisalsi TaxID=1000566 RepID=A0A839DN40_9PSEU|nr:ABC transporter family substrate-binding protein [Halosaccharopolyspora lacisalsi]MBA8822924.1 ABC-type transport system substrate-binding protein [Halosaccharopolyspora lacisalsi]
MNAHRGRRRPLTAALLLLTLSVLAGCTNAPPPPLVKPSPSSSPTTVPSKPPKPKEVVVGVGELRGGFNPHALADISPATRALSSLMLPSVFEPGPDGKPRLNTMLMESAEVVDDGKGRESGRFTVRYRIRTDAGWSDGAPLAAEDFVYLWKQLRSQPGVAEPAGYRMIHDVNSRQAGKTVEVSFSRPYPGWRQLFDNLLPAHLLQDAPGGWADALDDGYPASAGPYAIRRVDLDRGEIVLMRNERYWGPPAKTDRIVLRASDQSGQVEALRSGDTGVALFRADAATMEDLRGLGDSVRLSTVPSPATTQLLLRPNSPRLSDRRVREAVVAALDREALIDVGSGGGPGRQLPAHSQVLAPSESGYQPTEPAGTFSGAPKPQRVARLLTEAGYRRDGDVWSRDGHPLELVIAAQFRSEHYVRLAEATADQLREQGIQARVITPRGDELFGSMLPSDPLAEGKQRATVDMAITPRPAGGDPASMMASRWGCPATSPSGGHSFPHNMAGFCDPLLQPTIEAALSGRIPFSEASSRVESTLWARAVALPLYQHAQVLAISREVKGVEQGNGFASPLDTAGNWIGAPAETYDW